MVREVLEQEQWGLSQELRQTLLSLSIFQQLDGALLCLLQQPLPKNPVHRRPPRCCELPPVLNPRLYKPFQHGFPRPTPNLTIALASAIPTNLLSTPAFPGFCNEVQTTELPTSSLNSLENLAPPLRLGVSPAQNTHLLSTLGGGGRGGGGGPSPEAYLAGNQQAWLALRLHQHPRWHLPFFSCLRTSPEP